MTPLQITFIVITVLLVIFAVSLLLYRPIMKKYTEKHYKNSYYKKVYKTTLYGDYFLINDFLFFHEDNKTTTIDHLMLGEKFIYIIKDYYFKGSLKGDGNDKSLVLLKDDKSKTKQYVDNPLAESKIIAKRLSLVTGIDEMMIIGVSIVNDECNIDVNLTDNQFYIVKSKDFEKLVHAIESRPIQLINQEELQKVVTDLDKMNKKGKKHVKANI